MVASYGTSHFFLNTSKYTVFLLFGDIVVVYETISCLVSVLLVDVDHPCSELKSKLVSILLFINAISTENVVFTPIFSERSEEHTSELQSRQYLVCRLLLE